MLLTAKYGLPFAFSRSLQLLQHASKLELSVLDLRVSRQTCKVGYLQKLQGNFFIDNGCQGLTVSIFFSLKVFNSFRSSMDNSPEPTKDLILDKIAKD